MKHGIVLGRGLSARFLFTAIGVAALATACGDDDDGSFPSTGGTAGVAGKTGTSGSGGSTAGRGGSTTTGGSDAGSPGTSGSGGSGGSAGSGGSTAGTAAGGTPDEGGAGGEPTIPGASGAGGEGGQPPTEPVAGLVFGDAYADGVSFVQFGGSVNDVTIDSTTAHAGSSSLKIVVPVGGYTGGALVSATDQDLSQYNAVTFWAKASIATTLNAAGLGNDATANSPRSVERNNMAVTEEWQRFVIPIPDPTLNVAENGLFHFAEADAASYNLWLDDVRYTTVDGLGVPTASIATENRTINVGGTFLAGGTSAVYTLDAAPVTLALGAGWFDFISANDAVASVEGNVVTGEAEGMTEITAELHGVLASGKYTVTVATPSVPEVAATTPTNAEQDVISLFSNAFPNVNINTWSAVWDNADVTDVLIATNTTKLYTNLNFAGVDFGDGNLIDATAMTHLHVDVWLPVVVAAPQTAFKIKLVDFGANGVYNGTGQVDDTEFEVATPVTTAKTWQSIEIPLANFTGLGARAHLAQMIIAADAGSTVYFDNFYFHK
jgi:hypothetical protein